MARYPPGFVADLRSVRSWPELEDSLWRAPYLVRLTFGHAHGLIREFLPPESATVLDVGSGTGFLSLEMARDGHRVIALDEDDEAIELATASLRSDPQVRDLITYHRHDVADWTAPPESFDAVVISRTLHHVRDPSEVLANIRRWLRPRGRLICLDFTYDRFDRRAGRWMASVRALLESVGAYATQELTTATPVNAIDHVVDSWHHEHAEHDLRTSAEMLDPLLANFSQHHLSWHPYLYWEVIEDLRVAHASAEERLASAVMQWEQYWLAEDEIPAVLFLFVGEPP
jgi:ubiquinone/menaquinone biosynthesis C-methylase UbiE